MGEYRHADLVREIVNAAPPLTADQRARIAILLRGTAPPLTCGDNSPANASDAA